MRARRIFLLTILCLLVILVWANPRPAQAAGGLGTPCEENPDVCAPNLVCMPEGADNALICSHCTNSAECAEGQTCTGEGNCTGLPTNNNNPPPNNQPPSNNNTNNSSSSSGGFDFSIQGLVRLVTGVACWSVRAVLALMVIALIIAGLRFFTARGDPTAVGKAKTNFYWVLAGVAVILATNIIISTIGQAIAGNQFTFSALDCSWVEGGPRYNACKTNSECAKYGAGYKCNTTDGGCYKP